MANTAREVSEWVRSASLPAVTAWCDESVRASFCGCGAGGPRRCRMPLCGDGARPASASPAADSARAAKAGLPRWAASHLLPAHDFLAPAPREEPADRTLRPDRPPDLFLRPVARARPAYLAHSSGTRRIPEIRTRRWRNWAPRLPPTTPGRRRMRRFPFRDGVFRVHRARAAGLLPV